MDNSFESCHGHDPTSSSTIDDDDDRDGALLLVDSSSCFNSPKKKNHLTLAAEKNGDEKVSASELSSKDYDGAATSGLDVMPSMMPSMFSPARSSSATSSPPPSQHPISTTDSRRKVTMLSADQLLNLTKGSSNKLLEDNDGVDAEENSSDQFSIALSSSADVANKDMIQHQETSYRITSQRQHAGGRTIPSILEEEHNEEIKSSTPMSDFDFDASSSAVALYPGARAVAGADINRPDFESARSFLWGNTSTSASRASGNILKGSSLSSSSKLRKSSKMELMVAAELAPDHDHDDQQLFLQQLEREREELQRQLDEKEEQILADAAQAEIVKEPCRICGYHWGAFCCVFVIICIIMVIVLFAVDDTFWVNETGWYNREDSDAYYKRMLLELYSPFTDVNLLQNDTTPQGRAMEWLVNELPYLDDEYKNSTLLETFSLLVMSYSTNEIRWIPNWKVYDDYCVSESSFRKGDLYYNLFELDLVPICEWNDEEIGEDFDGVQCNSEGRSSVVKLQLDNFQMESSIPSEIQLLSNLEILNLERNRFYGSIPSELSLLKNLSTLRLGHNNLTFIPTELSTLSRLHYVDLSFNLIKDTNLDPILCEGRRYKSNYYLAADCLVSSSDFGDDQTNNTSDGSSTVVCSCCTMCCNSSHCEKQQ